MEIVRSMKRGSNFKFQISNSAAGFTLFELVVAIGLFSVLVISVVSLMLKIIEVQKRTISAQTILDNVRFGMELLTRELRAGFDYKLSASCGTLGQELTFITSAGERRIYFLNQNEKKIMKIAQPSSAPIDCAQALPFSSDEVAVNKLGFFVEGETYRASDGQPWVTITMNVSPKNTEAGPDESSINLQTTIVSRIRDF